MRVISLFLLVCSLTASVYARDLPKDGNDLLDYCSVMLDLADNQSAAASLSTDALTVKLAQLDWCAGYIQGTEDVYETTFVNLGVFGMAGMTFAGPEKLTKYAAEKLRGPCFPGNAPVLQLARVLVKWLREHPERLHEGRSILTTAAFTDSFPCEQTPPKEAAKPTPAKP
jgi:hypothetical protein